MTLTLETLYKTRTMAQTHVVPRFTYLGAGAKNKSIQTWLELTKGVGRYIDVTAGSCNQPYAVGKQHQVPVVVNDASHYSYCIGVGLFHRRAITDLNRFAEVLVEATDSPVEGTFCSVDEAHKIPIEVRSYIDGLVLLIDQKFAEADAAFLKAVIGKTILTLYTMRNLAWAVPKNRDVYKMPLTVENFAIPAYKGAVSKNFFYHPGQAYWSGVRDFLEFCDFTDASVNFDPAWPFADPKQINPYHMYFTLGCVLAQRPLCRFNFWRSEKTENVVEEFTFWVQRCLERGAREVFAWNQTTNNPSRELLTSVMSEKFHCEEILEVKRGSTGHKYIFTDYVLKLRGK